MSNFLKQILAGVLAMAMAPIVGSAQSYPFIKDPLKPWINISDLQNWQGLHASGNTAEWNIPGRIVYTHPDDNKDTYPSIGLLSKGKDGTMDLRYWYGVRFDITLDTDKPFIIQLAAHIPQQGALPQLPDSSTAEIQIQGKGEHTVTIPFSLLDYNRGQLSFLQNVKQLSLLGQYQGEKTTGKLLINKIKIIRGNSLHFTAKVRSLPAGQDSSVIYTASLTNCMETAQSVTLTLQKTGWEGMLATISPQNMTLGPGESRAITVKVTVPATVPQGAQETQTLLAASAAGGPPEIIEFITSRKLRGPYLVHNEEGWQQVLANSKKYDWGKQGLKELTDKADAWVVPAVPPEGILSDQGTMGLFKAYLERDLWPTALAWKLTGERKYGEKAALFLRRFTDPKNGYPATLHATIQGQPQEGSFLEGVVRSYDLLRNSDLLTEGDKSQIDTTLRLYIGVVEQMMANGGISNWTLFNQGPAAQCALALQDFTSYNYLMNGPCGVIDQMRYGILDDGWWYEMSLSYNLACGEVLTSLGLAAQPFGIDFLHAQYPVSLTNIVGLRNFERGNQQGMAFTKYGPVTHNFITIKKMWDGIAPYPDYRGVMFGMGDGHEDLVSGNVFELAYYAYRDPAYAAIIKQGPKRNLIYAVGELPENTPKLYTQTTYSPDAGITVLRSQTDGRPQSAQLQAAVKYGTHGSYHGHFDRVSLVSLMRYGESFYNPETSWYGYPSYMYKWWVQTSLSHNMVVVDGKMQEPKESKQLLFYAGKMLQASATETYTRWSNPPYMGGYNQLDRIKAGTAPYVPLPTVIPDFFEVTEFTEPILQRRLTLVTDDYVVLLDYLKGTQSHLFDNLLHLRGAKPDVNLPFAGHDAQFDTNPLSSGQFITNVNKYRITGTAKISSVMRFAEKGPDGHNKEYNNWETGGGNRGFNEPGNLNIDAWHLWPKNADLLMADYPESWAVNKKLFYSVTGDGKTLVADSLGTWILGKGVIDADIKGLKELKLITHTNRTANTLKTLFWANAEIVTADGKVIPASQLKTSKYNVIPTGKPGLDYADGPVRIAGNNYTDVIPAEPDNITMDAIVTIDLSGLKAVRLKSIVGGDWPVGNEEQLRKVVDFRTKGTSANFVTILEPYKDEGMIISAEAINANKIKVKLKDGRQQEILITDFDGSGKNLQAVITETKDGTLLRTERTTEIKQ